LSIFSGLSGRLQRSAGETLRDDEVQVGAERTLRRFRVCLSTEDQRSQYPRNKSRWMTTRRQWSIEQKKAERRLIPKSISSDSQRNGRIVAGGKRFVDGVRCADRPRAKSSTTS
jgi:hypothetical protein